MINLPRGQQAWPGQTVRSKRCAKCRAQCRRALEAILTRAAEEAAKRALADVGLDGDEPALDIRDLRSLVDCIRLVRRTAMQTAVRMITTGVMLALLAGIAIKLKIFGGSP
jgi:hypothetical protein